MRRYNSRIRYGLIAVVTLALAGTAVVLVTSPSANADEVPGPLLLAGSDCDEGGPFVQYRVTNESDGVEMLTLAIDSDTAIGSTRLDAGQSKRGRIEWSGSPAQSVVLEARWASNDTAPVSTISVAPNPCVATSAAGFTGPGFMAGTECRDERPLVRWWLSNTADDHRLTYVSIGNEDGTTGETIWPGDGVSELMFAGAQTGGVSEIPIDYVPGSEIRVSGWAEGSFGVAETWTQMVVPLCGPGGREMAGAQIIGGAEGSAPQESAATDPGSADPATVPQVATTIAFADGTTAVPAQTTTTRPGDPTTTVAGSSTTTAAPGATTTSLPGSTTRPPETTTTATTRPPASTTTTTTTTTVPPPVDIAPPVFLAGADCGENGAFIRYRVTNNNATAQTLQVTFNGTSKVSNLSVGGRQTKWGTFSPGAGVNDPRPVVASWVGQPGSAAPTLLMRASICEAGLPQPARGPSFVAGQDCSGGTPIVRWWMRNSAPTTQQMNVTLTDDDNSGERIMWPGSGSTVDVAAGVQAAASFTLPTAYNRAGQEVRLRGWWRGIDANAHNRVGIVLQNCS